MFSHLSTTESIYFYIALFGSVLFIVQSVFTFLDIGDSFDMDSNFDGHVDIEPSHGLGLPFSIITVRGIVGFILLFGWSGFLFSKNGLSLTYTILFSFLCGFILMILIAFIYHLAHKLEESGNVDLKTAIGKEGEVYIPIPAEKSGTGKISIIINESYREYDAITNGGMLKTGELVKVIEILNDILVVEKINN